MCISSRLALVRDSAHRAFSKNVRNDIFDNNFVIYRRIELAPLFKSANFYECGVGSDEIKGFFTKVMFMIGLTKDHISG